MYQIHKDGSFDVHSYNTTVDLSKYDQKKLINKDPEEFFDDIFNCCVPTASNDIANFLTVANSTAKKNHLFCCSAVSVVKKKKKKKWQSI